VLEQQLNAFEALTAGELACTSRIGTDVDLEDLERRAAELADTLEGNPREGSGP
jgi:hypothetical protein